MMTRPQHIFTLMALVLTAPVATAQYQYPTPAGNCANGSCGFPPTSNSYAPAADYRPLNDYSTATPYRNTNADYNNDNSTPPGYRDSFDSFRRRLTDERYRLTQGYDYRAPLNSAVDDSFRTPLNDYTPDRGRDLHEAYENRGRLADPFRLPASDTFDRNQSYRNVPLSRDYPANTDYQSRYRVPLDRVDYSNYDRSYQPAPLSRDRYDAPSGGIIQLDHYRAPVPEPYQQVRPGLDPFTPPLPRRDGDNEVEAINKAISARYGNPVNVRSAKAMTATQALALYREVSQQTDQRHLEPSPYDLRVRRGIRNLGLALENRTFVQSLGIQADSFRVDGFRTTLSRIAEGMRVANYNDAQQIVQTVMQEAQSVPGLNPNVVAFEFANATIDTLDKFSALEPAEPGRGASLDLQRAEHVRSAALESEIVGIGVEVKVHENGLLIMKTLRGGPAADAKLQSGDIITAIDGRSIGGMPMANSVDLMKGSSGSRIQLTISRNGSRGSNVTLTRRSIRVYTVNDMKILPGTENVAYMSLSQFGQKSTEEMDQALNQLYNNGMKSLILDLRGNPGGLLNVCVDITNRFLPCGTIVSTKGRLASDNMIESATYDRTWSTPLVVLVDGDSASASEIFAAAVQDNRRGIVVGERSYGKGTVQTHFPLSTVGGNLRLTTARFYSPNGRAMSGEGVTPDVRIADADGPANGDRQLEEAVQIAQSQRLKDIAQAARQCRPSANQPLQRNSMKGQDIDDQVAPKTVLR
ncbi:MAG: S41 family peptidase [Planctomycetaceae bacterium]